MKMNKSISRIHISINQTLLMNPKVSTMNRSTMEQTILSFISGLWTRNMSNLSLKDWGLKSKGNTGESLKTALH